MRRILLSFVACAVLAPYSQGKPRQAAGQTAPQPQRDPQALAILQQTVKLMGGAAPSDSTATGTVTGMAGSQAQDGTIRILTRNTDESLEELTLPNLSQTTVYSRWMASQSVGSAAAQGLSSQLAATAQAAEYPLPLLAGALSNPDTTLQYVGPESLAGAATNHIRIWNTFASLPYMQPLAGLSTRDIWIDSASGLPVKISFTQQAALGATYKTLVELSLSNYEQTAGFAYPSQIRESLNGTLWLTISIQSMVFNTGLSDSQFQISCN